MADSDYGDWIGFQSTSLTSITPDNLDPDAEFEIQVRAVSSDGVASDWTPSIYFTTPSDVTPPSVPSTPIVTSKLGAFTIEWDGKTVDGGTMEADFLTVRVYVQVLGSSTISQLSDIHSKDGGQVIWTDCEYNTDYIFTLTAVDTTGNESAASTSVTARVTPLVDTDVIGKIITGGNVVDGSITSVQIGDEQITAGKIDTGAITETKISDDAITTPKIEAGAVIADKLATNSVTADKIASASVTTDKLRVGTATNIVPDPTFQSDDMNSLRLDSTCDIYQRASTLGREIRVSNSDSYRLWLIGNKTASTSANPPAFTLGSDTNGWVPVQAGDSWFFSGVFLRNGGSGAGGGVRFQANFKDGQGNAIGGANYFGQTTVTNNSLSTVQASVTVPDQAAWMAGAWVFDGDSGGATGCLEAPKCWQQVSSVLIQDGAVTADKIQALAVTADKIDANAITADKIHAGAIDGMTISGATIAGGLFRSSDRTASNATGSSENGFWIDGTGYLNVTAAGIKFFEIDPYGEYTITLGRKDSGYGYLAYDATFGTTTLHDGDLEFNYSTSQYSALVGYAQSDRYAFYSNGSADLIGSEGSTIVSGGTMEIGASDGNVDKFTGGNATYDASATFTAAGVATIEASDNITLNGGKVFGNTGGADLTLNNDGNPRVWSMAVWNRVYSGSAGNAHITNQGTIGTTGSALKYKVNVEPKDFGEAVLDLQPKVWFDKGATEAWAKALKDADGDLAKASEAVANADIPDLIEIPGLIAEDVAESGLEHFVIRDSKGDLQSISYERLWIPLIPIIKKQRDQIADLETRLAALEKSA